MEALLITTLALSFAAAYRMRHAISRALARRIAIGSALGILVSVTGFGALVGGGTFLSPPWPWGLLLLGLLVVSVCTAPFGFLPFLAERRE